MKARGRMATRSALALEPGKHCRWAPQLSFACGLALFQERLHPQAQLFAMLALKQCLRQDYRGVVVLLSEWSEFALRVGAKERCRTIFKPLACSGAIGHTQRF